MASARCGQTSHYIRSIELNLARSEGVIRYVKAEPLELRPHDTRSELSKCTWAGGWSIGVC